MENIRYHPNLNMFWKVDMDNMFMVYDPYTNIIQTEFILHEWHSENSELLKINDGSKMELFLNLIRFLCIGPTS